MTGSVQRVEHASRVIRQDNLHTFHMTNRMNHPLGKPLRWRSDDPTAVLGVQRG